MESTSKIEEVLEDRKSERLQKIQELSLELWRDKAAFFRGCDRCHSYCNGNSGTVNRPL